jgi:hypothetical protein
LFVVPATKRIDGYPKALTSDVHYRTGVDEQMQDIVESHYATFIHLAYPHRNLAAQPDLWVEYSYTHLVSAVDLAEMFLKRCYRLLWQLQRVPPPATRSPNSEAFLRQHLKDTAVWTDLQQYRAGICTFRHAFIHNTLIGRIVKAEDGRELIPRPEIAGDYSSWRRLYAVRNDRARIDRDFVEPSEQLQQDLTRLENTLNRLWAPVIAAFESEFYSPDSRALPKNYGIEFNSMPHREGSQQELHCLFCGCLVQEPLHRLNVQEYSRSQPSGASGVYLNPDVTYLRCPECGTIFQMPDSLTPPDQCLVVRSREAD